MVWTVSGGDPVSGPGTINRDGQYTPPPYLTEDRVGVVVRASLESQPAVQDTAIIWVSPGLLQPPTPENAASGVNGTVLITGYLAQIGGNTGISYSIWGSSPDESATSGWLSDSICKREATAFTSCSVTYHAPSAIVGNRVVKVTATIGSVNLGIATRILLNAAGISSNPASHQAQTSPNLQLGGSGGNDSDYDSIRGRVVDCCGGTLGGLLKGSDDKQYVLSNNHVLARSDHASVGDPIVEPGLIDTNCAPSSMETGPAPIAGLTDWLALDSNSTNVDAAIAEIRASAVDSNGSILEMGPKQSDGTLSAAPPGISSSGGRGKPGSLQLIVAKSGRTTGQTCAAITAIDVDVNVGYYLDCAESKQYLNKTFTHQLAMSGDGFGDAGDSGSLILDAASAEPVGLYFAGGIDSLGVSQAMANPAPEVLNELNARVGKSTTFTFVGMQDHPVSCLSYGDSTRAMAQAQVLSDAEIKRAQDAVADGRGLVNSAIGILGVGSGKSNDRPGEAALIVYIAPKSSAKVPKMVDGVRTVVSLSNEHPGEDSGLEAFVGPPAPASPAISSSALNAALEVKQRVASDLMKQNPAYFAVGVGQSLDNPGEPALIIFVDRLLLPKRFPRTLGGLRTRFIVMDRLHVTRSFSLPASAAPRCASHLTALSASSGNAAKQ